MSTEEYLAALTHKLQGLAGLLITSSVRQEIDTNLGVGFIKGRLIFVDGSILDFSEQLPPTRQKYRIHYMTATEVLVARWDSAPHFPLLPTFPFHKHTPQGVEAHEAVTLVEVLDEVVAHLAV